MPPKRKKSRDTDRAASTSSPAPNLEQMSEKERKKFISDITRQNKKLDADAKKKKASAVKRAEKQAEVDYTAPEPAAKKQKTSATASSSTVVTKKSASVAVKSKNTAAAKDSGTDSGSEASDIHSSVAYDSGKDKTVPESNVEAMSSEIPIDPVLLAADAASAAATAGKKKARAVQSTAAKDKGAAAQKVVQPGTPTPSTRGKGPATVNVGVAKALGNTLKAPRTFQKGLIRAMTSSESDKDDSSTSDSSSSSDDEGANDVQGDFTPYQRPKVKDRRAFPALSAMSPTTRPRLEDARSRYSVWLATHDAFPPEKEARRAARGAMLTELDTVHRSCADESDVEEQQRIGRRVTRFHKQPSYKRDTTGITEGVDSTFRGHIVYDAESLVAAEWKLDDLNEDECREKVQNLLHKGNFAFADWEGEKRSGMFGCPVLPKLLRKAFLTKAVKKGLPLGLGENLPTFAEVPPALIGFLLTAIECVLRRWTTGTYNTNASHFTLATYEPIYTRHLKALHQAQTRSPNKLDAARKEIWAAASKNIGGSVQATVIDDADGYMCDADFEDDDVLEGMS